MVTSRFSREKLYLCPQIIDWIKMNIEYSSSKEVKCYRDFVTNPDNRNASRVFSKTFGANLMEPAKKLHDRLKKYVSAGAYNAIFGKQTIE